MERDTGVEPGTAEAVVATWIERELGGRVRSIAPQARWRPVWFVDLETDEGVLELCVRGDRTDMALIFPLEHEMRFQQLLHEHGVRTARVYGWIPELPAYVMDRVPGRPDFEGCPAEERDAVVDDYLGLLVRLHSLPVEPFVAAGITRADDPDASGEVGIARYEEVYRQQKNHPDPFMEFCLGWLHRHPTHSHGRETPVVWDSGQFHHADGAVTAVLDVELGHLGDPMMDLAGWRMRDSIIGYGDFDRLYGRYEELGGGPVDLDAVRRHHVAFTLTNQLVFSAALHDPPPGSDLMTNLQWCRETNLYATEALAEILDLELPGVDTPEPRRSLAAPAHQHQVALLRSTAVDDEYLRYQLRASFRMARHLQRVDEIGEAVAGADLDDLHELLGHRPDTWHDGEAELERFVLGDVDTGRHDEALVALFHRRNLRAQMVLGPEGSAMTRHTRIQPFGSSAGRGS